MKGALISKYTIAPHDELTKDAEKSHLPLLSHLTAYISRFMQAMKLEIIDIKPGACLNAHLHRSFSTNNKLVCLSNKAIVNYLVPQFFYYCMYTVSGTISKM